MFTFKTHPAAVSVTDGVGLAFGYMMATWKTWLPVLGALAAINIVLVMAIYDTIGDGLYYVNRWTGEFVWVPDAGDRIRRAVPFFILLMIATTVAGWVFPGMAIAGLRGWRLTPSVVLSRGLVSVAAILIAAAATVGGAMAVFVLLAVVPPLGVLAAIAAFVIAIYAWVRISFATLAIFDGFGPVGGLQESWRLSEGAVGRMIGWALMAMLIGIGFSIVAGIGSAPFAGSTSSSMALSQGISVAVTSAATVVTVFLQAVLYESQRARHDPSLYPFAAYPAAPMGPVPAYPYPYAYPPPAAPAPNAAQPEDVPQSATETTPPSGWPPQAG